MFTIVAAGAVAACVAALLFSRPAGSAERYVFPISTEPEKADPLEDRSPSQSDVVSGGAAPSALAEGAMLAENVAASAGEQITALRRTAANLRRLAPGAGASLEGEVRSLNLLVERMDAWRRRILLLARPPVPRLIALDLNRAISVCLTALSQADGAASRISFDPDPNVTQAVVDLEMLHQLMVNLVERAQRSSGPTGLIEIRTQAMGDQVLIALRDDGPWMTRPELAALFAPAGTEPPSPQGLSLALCRSLVTALRGSIGAVNVHPRGVEVGVRLPADDGRKTPSPQN